MTPPLVHVLEAIEVDEQQGVVAVCISGLAPTGLETFAIERAGEPVEARHTQVLVAELGQVVTRVERVDQDGAQVDGPKRAQHAVGEAVREHKHEREPEADAADHRDIGAAMTSVLQTDKRKEAGRTHERQQRRIGMLGGVEGHPEQERQGDHCDHHRHPQETVERVTAHAVAAAAERSPCSKR